MGKVNVGRVILGGLVAGVVINIGEFLLNAVIMKSDWDAAMAALNLPPADSGGSIAIFVLSSFVFGLLGVWMYAAVRPRLGAGPKTAIIVGLFMWMVGCVLAMLPPLVTRILPANLVMWVMVWCLFEAPIAALAGAAVYKEA